MLIQHQNLCVVSIPEVIGKLLEEENLSEEELNAVLKSVKIFFKVVYEIFAGQESDHEKKTGEILTNPFYCGMMVHRVLEGEALEGRHEKLISKEMFLQVNEILAERKLGLQTK